MKIILIGCVQFTKQALVKLIALKADLVGVITKEESPFNADFEDLAPVCRHYGIPCLQTDDVNAEATLRWVRERMPDVIFCFGWSNLIKKELLEMPPRGVIGYHPAALPENRGRHPIVWALALGLEKTASTFFYMDEGADSGDLLDQLEVVINYKDKAADLYRKVTETALVQIENFLPGLSRGNAQRIPQDHSRANAWRKRSVRDGAIDFRMSSRSIYNLVRALSPPYPGAHLQYKDSEVKVWEAREEAFAAANFEPGKVLAVRNGEILVKCDGQAIWLVKHELNPLPRIGEYL